MHLYYGCSLIPVALQSNFKILEGLNPDSRSSELETSLCKRRLGSYAESFFAGCMELPCLTPTPTLVRILYCLQMGYYLQVRLTTL